MNSHYLAGVHRDSGFAVPVNDRLLGHVAVRIKLVVPQIKRAQGNRTISGVLQINPFAEQLLGLWISTSFILASWVWFCAMNFNLPAHSDFYVSRAPIARALGQRRCFVVFSDG